MSLLIKYKCPRCGTEVDIPADMLGRPDCIPCMITMEKVKDEKED